MSFQNALLVIGGIGALWFFARFMAGPKRSTSALLSMFKREPKIMIAGLGPKAIATLTGEFRALAIAHPAVDGAMLVGPFAAGEAHAHSPVNLVLAVSDLAPFATRDWLEAWAYVTKGHSIQRHRVQDFAGGTCHEVTLRGAPAIVIHVIDRSGQTLPDGLLKASREGTVMLDDPRGRCDTIRRVATGEATQTPSSQA